MKEEFDFAKFGLIGFLSLIAVGIITFGLVINNAINQRHACLSSYSQTTKTVEEINQICK